MSSETLIVVRTKVFRTILEECFVTFLFLERELAAVLVEGILLGLALEMRGKGLGVAD